MINQKKFLFVILILFTANSLLGCAGRPMAISPENKSLNTESESVALLVVRTKNIINEGYLPEIQVVKILNRDSKKTIKFDCTDSIINPTEAYLDHLISFQLPSGEYEIKELTGIAQVNRSEAMSLLVAPANFSWEMCGMFELNSNEIVYLGHLELINRERNEGEKASGSVIPIIPQSASGFARGTFDVIIDDRKDEDMKLVSNSYQWIDKYSINTSLLQLLDDKEN